MLEPRTRFNAFISAHGVYATVAELTLRTRTDVYRLKAELPSVRQVVIIGGRYIVELADQVEQQLSARAGEGQVAELIENDDVEAAELGRQRTGLGAGVTRQA